MKKRFLLVLQVFAMMMLLTLMPMVVLADNESSIVPTEYTYEIIPLLEPFNQYFFIKTDNPDPWSFQFVDKNSVYSENATLTLLEDTFKEDDLFADVVYENRETKRVNGGYIFSSVNIDGGEIVLQTVKSYDYWGNPQEWQDTDIKIILPKLCDVVDYLIDTYAEGDTYFDKMNAIQRGFSSICLYSGSYIRGTLIKNSEFWSLARAPHIDQVFYIFSPYDRKDNRYLFASQIYPFIYDSLGFPSVMANVSKRLDEASSYVWTPGQHAYIDVTYNGETRTYGGAGTGNGQGLTEDKIARFFTFDYNEKITLEASKKLLNDYSQVEVEDDIPREDALTWEKICNTVGDGSWVHMTNGYAYLYKSNDDNSYWAEEWGVGYSIYWGGSLGYASNTWIDGRYVGKWYRYESGVTFEDYPNSDIMLTNTVIPKVTYDTNYEYNSDTGRYETVYTNVQVTEHTGVLRYCYDKEKNVWTASDYGIFADMAERGLVDEKYLDMLQLTYDEVMELDIDRNTNITPDRGYIFDGSAEPGTTFDRSMLNTVDHDVLFADAKDIAEKNGLDFSLKDGHYGMCGESMIWTYLEDSQTLIITGSGDMHTLGKAPWCLSPTDDCYIPIKQLIVGEGVVSIQNEAFSYCFKLGKAVLPESLKKIGDDAFKGCNELVIYGFPDSTAQTYANNYNIEFIIIDEKTDNEKEIGDVEEDSWQYSAVNYVYTRGIMTGKGEDANGNTKFAPNDTLSREEFAQILYAAEGKPEITSTKKFLDVTDGNWYTKAILWAAEQGIVSGYENGKFGVGDNITREQLAAMLYKYAEYKKYDTTARQDLNKFVDHTKISSWAINQLQWAVANGVLSGKGSAEKVSLDAFGKATRAECAAMLRTFFTKFES